MLVNFNKFVEQHILTTEITLSTKSAFWKEVSKWTKSGKSFFRDMDMMDDANHLWEYVSTYTTPTILSATGHVMNAATEKKEWVISHLGDSAGDSAIFIRDGKDKALYATPTSILIDDRSVAIDPWIVAGGIGILHTSAATTISKLRELGV